MKKLILAAIFTALAFSAQAQVMRGEISAGNYENIKSTSQSLNVTLSNSTAAAALADAAANPTTTTIGADNSVFNGTTWDRWRGSSLTNGTGIAKVTIAGVGDPCLSSETPKSSAIIAITTAATTALVAPSASTIVYVCDFTFSISQVVTTANTLKFVQGTGAACVTAQSDLTGLFGAGGVTAGIPIIVSATSSGSVFKTTAAGGLCAVTAIGASGTFQGVLTFVQQ